MTDETFEGWTNRETWAASLYISNEEAWYHQARAVTSQALEDETGERFDDLTAEQRTRHVPEVADALKTAFAETEWDLSHVDDVYGRIPAHLAGVVQEIGSLWRINWEEIARHQVED